MTVLLLSPAPRLRPQCTDSQTPKKTLPDGPTRHVSTGSRPARANRPLAPGSEADRQPGSSAGGVDPHGARLNSPAHRTPESASHVEVFSVISITTRFQFRDKILSRNLLLLSPTA